MPQDLAHLISRILAFRDARNWCPFHVPKDLALALNIKAGELAELLLWKTEAEATGMAADPVGRTAIADELADVAIYALLLADRFGINLGEAVVEKIGKNEVMYPAERARGNARKYADFGEWGFAPGWRGGLSATECATMARSEALDRDLDGVLRSQAATPQLVGDGILMEA